MLHTLCACWTLFSACAFTVCCRYLRRLLANCLNTVLHIIEVIPAVMTTVTKISIYSFLYFNLVFAHSFTLPEFFLNHSKSSILSVLQCSFLHPFLALLNLLWTNSAPQVSLSLRRFASTLRQLPCDHRRKWWQFTWPCLHWYLWIGPFLITMLRSWLTWASRSRLHDLLHTRSVLEVADVRPLSLAGCVSRVYATVGTDATLRLVLQRSSGGQQIFSDHAWHDVTPAPPDFVSPAGVRNVFGCSGDCNQSSSSIFCCSHVSSVVNADPAGLSPP